jgi:hypothetical protein
VGVPVYGSALQVDVGTLDAQVAEHEARKEATAAVARAYGALEGPGLALSVSRMRCRCSCVG